MNPYETIMNALAVLARQDLHSAMILEACLEFTMDELHDISADTYFRDRFGERLHERITKIINHK